MLQKRFSIIIPTRQRHETLRFSLKTCLEQKNFEDYEIVVCDNYSSQETKEVVESFNSTKIRYIRSEKPLAMVDNFELAISQSQGEYLMILGDDDGLILDALYNLNEIIKRTDFKVISWSCLFYQWPSSVSIGLENQLTIPLNSEIKIVDSNHLISNVANGRQYYSALPMIYTNGIIHRDLIAEIKKITGRVFYSISPDIYSGFVFAYLSKEFFHIGRPFSVSGLSSKSNGNNSFNTSWSNKITSDFINLNNTSEVKFHPKLPFINSLSIMVAEVFLQAKDRLFPNDDALVLDEKGLVKNCMKDLKAFSIEEWHDAVDLIKRFITSNNPQLKKWFQEYIKGIPPKIFRPYDEAPKKGLHGDTIYLDASGIKCENVYDIAVFYDRSMAENVQLDYDKLKGESANRNGFLPKITKRIKEAARVLIKG